MDTEKAKVEEYQLKGEYYIEGAYFVDAQEIPAEGKQRRHYFALEGFFLGVTREFLSRVFILHFLRDVPEADGTLSRFTIVLGEREAGEVLVDIIRFCKKALTHDITLRLSIDTNELGIPYPIPSVSYRIKGSISPHYITPYVVYKRDYEALRYTINSLLSASISEEMYDKSGADIKQAIREAIRKPYSEKQILGRIDSTYNNLVRKGVIPAPAPPKGK